ncbi:MAG: hypothetical protein AYK18_17520 [Theionarchaea archaeon DG-70]|nr:MAG: hypothetical protein AYK18_17520 [Theionarchaea archaeon DG-70]
MKILLVQDEGIKIDLERSSNILNDLCNTVRFESYKSPINVELPSPYSIIRKTSYISLKKETELLSQITSNIEKDYLFYVTSRRHRDNYFLHASGNVIICSFFGWEYYTNLPVENGLFYFIADCLALQILEDFRHQKLTGCIYDFLGDKTGVDICAVPKTSVQ